MEACSDCGTHLYGGWVQRTREVIELPVVPVEVTEHVLVARICPYASGAGCPKRLSRNLSRGWFWANSVGVYLVSLKVILREEGRLPLQSIQWYLKTVHQLHLNVGAIVRAIHGVASQAQPAVPSDNNAAERSLRLLVTGRKITGGTLSDQGADGKMALAIALRRLKGPRFQSPPGMPPVTRISSTLNSYSGTC